LCGYYLINLAEKSIEITKEIRIGGKQLKDTNLAIIALNFFHHTHHPAKT
jgi:hypothetical protein